MGEAIVVTSGKGGVGKTTSSANIGTALAILGKSVCLLDTDIGLRNLDVIMGLESRILYNLVDVAEGNCRLQQALVKDKRVDHLFLLPAAQTKDKSAVQPEQVKRIVEELKRDFDYVMIDCPAGIEQGFQNAVTGADSAIVVTTPETAAVRDADRVIGLLLSIYRLHPRLVINRIRPQLVKRGEMLDVEEVMNILAVDLLGVVPDDEHVIRAGNQGEPVVFTTGIKASQAYRNIARRILGENVPLLPLEDQPGVMGRLARFFGRR